jgi:hypothetical protein
LSLARLFFREDFFRMTPLRGRKNTISHSRRFSSLAIVVLCCVATLPAQTSGFVFFDAPDAGTGDLQGTIPTGIAANGAIAGYYLDGKNEAHGFLRSPAGVITEFDPPSSSDNAVTGINLRGQIVGYGRQSAIVGFPAQSQRHVREHDPSPRR